MPYPYCYGNFYLYDDIRYYDVHLKLRSLAIVGRCDSGRTRDSDGGPLADACSRASEAYEESLTSR